MEETPIKKIAILRRNGLGDLVCAIPLINYCLQNIPQAQITLFVEERNEALVKYIPGLHEVVVFRGRHKYLRLFKALWKMKSRLFDLAISAKAGPMKLNHLFLTALPAKKKVSYVDGKWHGKFLNGGVPFSPDQIKEKHQALQLLHLLEPSLKEVPQNLFPRFVFPKQVLEKHEPILKKELQFGDEHTPVLLISINNNRPTSSLDPLSYALLLEQMSRKPRVVISCAAHQKEEGVALCKKLPTDAKVVITEDLDAFLVLLKLVDAVFVGDGGIMHMAACLDKPQLVLFGATSVTQWHPLSDKAECLRHPDDIKKLPIDTVVMCLERLMLRARPT